MLHMFLLGTCSLCIQTITQNPENLVYCTTGSVDIFIMYCTGTMWHTLLPTGPFTNTCLESPSYPLTLGAAHYRHSVVVGNVSYKTLRECDGGYSTLGGGGILVDQVGVGWVCTIVNGASVPWLKWALGIGWIRSVNMNSKNFGATCEMKA